MSAGSLAGFALVFVVCAWSLSAIGGLALVSARTYLERIGPLAQRRAAEAVAIVPIAVASVVTVTLIVQSMVGTDHCRVHGHHAHLCLVHGAHWLDRVGVVVALATVAATVLGRFTLVAVRFLRGRRSIRELRALSRVEGAVRVVDSPRAFCFVAGGRRPAIYVSSRAWGVLDDAERLALVAHESAHLDHGDLRSRVLIEVLLVLAAPLVGDPVRSRWLHAGELLCDAAAAEATGEPASVASAMVSLCRLHTSAPAWTVGFTPTGSDLAGRVHAVLVGGPRGNEAAALLERLAIAGLCVLLIGAAGTAETLHHAFETLLG
jgi:Zn-dependent protease with chaperone function